jgi:hypothetical protein
MRSEFEMNSNYLDYMGWNWKQKDFLQRDTSANTTNQK